MPHDSANVLGGGLLSTSIVEGVCFVNQEVKSNARPYFKVMEEGIDLGFHTRVIVKGIAIEVTKLRIVPLQSGASKGCRNIGFDKSHFLEGYQALKMLDDKYYVSEINVFAHRHYLTLPVRLIKVGVKVA